MKKSHESWNELHNASTNYPDALYKTTDRLEQRLKKESRKRKLLFTTIPTTAAALLFVILVNTNIAFARTISDIPLLSKISEMVMYNESLKSAVENKNIQYVNLKAESGDLELKLPYVIADSRNLVLFLQMPEAVDLKENEFYDLSVAYLRDLSTGKQISGGYLNFSGTYSLGQDPLMKTAIEFAAMYDDIPGYHNGDKFLPNDFELVMFLRKYESETMKLLAMDSFRFNLSLDPFKEPVVYPLNQEIILDGQKILFNELISYPTRSEISFDFSAENDADMNLRLSLVEDGIRTSLGSYAYMSQNLNGVHRETIHIESNYFDPPESRSISIDKYTLIRDEERIISIDLEDETMIPKPEEIELLDIERVNGEIFFTFKTSERYPYGPFALITDQGRHVEIIKEDSRSEFTYLYYIKDDNYKTLDFHLWSGPEVTLEEPILIPIPVHN